MKSLLSALMSAMLVMASSQVFAGAEDEAWISKCVADNQKEGATPDVVAKYCGCMNNKMSDSETQSISEWEKSHPTEMAACEAEAGWK